MCRQRTKSAEIVKRYQTNTVYLEKNEDKNCSMFCDLGWTAIVWGTPSARWSNVHMKVHGAAMYYKWTAEPLEDDAGWTDLFIYFLHMLQGHAYFSEHVWSGCCFPGEPDRCCVSVHVWQWIQINHQKPAWVCVCVPEFWVWSRPFLLREHYARDNSVNLTCGFSVASTRREIHWFTLIHKTLLVIHI